MAFTMDRSFPGARLDEIDRLTRAALSEAGFGVLTEIDVPRDALRSADGTPMADALLSAMHILGMDDVESFGDSSLGLSLRCFIVGLEERLATITRLLRAD